MKIFQLLLLTLFLISCETEEFHHQSKTEIIQETPKWLQGDFISVYLHTPLVVTKHNISLELFDNIYVLTLDDVFENEFKYIVYYNEMEFGFYKTTNTEIVVEVVLEDQIRKRIGHYTKVVD